MLPTLWAARRAVEVKALPSSPLFAAAAGLPRRLFYYNAGFWRDRRLRRILELAGHPLHLGLPKAGDGVAVWGHSPYAHRGESVSRRLGVPLVRLEDAFLRSVKPGRMGGASLGIVLDDQGVHYDPSQPSRLEQILAQAPLDDPTLIARAAQGIARLRAGHLSKYNLHDPACPTPPPGYVLVVDQTQGDASLRKSGATAQSFQAMLAQARRDHPQARLVLKTHPETTHGLRAGHFSLNDCDARTTLCADPVSPWALISGASAVYTISSQLGFEAILAGHRPVVFGQPFYAGWGLSQDRMPLARRQRRLSVEQLFAGAMLLAPLWYDPCRDALCSFEQALDQLEAETRAYREDRFGYVASEMRLWKRPRLQAFFGAEKPLRFAKSPAKAMVIAESSGRQALVWAGRADQDQPVIRVEDGFLRSRGLGAALVPPLSLVRDDIGIYYDPSRESRFELILQQPLPPGGASRAAALQQKILHLGLSKYNLTGDMPDLPSGHRILIPGQVEDDASIRKGAGSVRDNLALIQAARAAHPQAVLVYKPHPDVEAGLRPGAIPPAQLQGLVQVVAHHADPMALIAACDEVWTMTSLLGFEALLRGKAVTCLGAPFYAGWGLTRDLGPIPARRHQATQHNPPDLTRLIYAALIGYPRYYDPISRLPCPPEVALHRLAQPQLLPHSTPLRLLAKLQGALASYAGLWRR